MTDALSAFFAILTMCCFAAVAGIALLATVSARRPTPAVVSLSEAVRSVSLWFGWLVAAVTTAGSLYYSLGADYVPCELCWYQRICIYPFVVILLVAAWRNDTSAWRSGLPITIVGIAVSAYHTQLQAFPEQQTFCSTVTPCTVRYVWVWGFVSMPLMALAAQLVIATVLVLARADERRSAPAETAGATDVSGSPTSPTR